MTRWKNILLALLFLGIAGVVTWAGIHYQSTSFSFFPQSERQPPIPSLSIGVVDINSIKNNSKVFQKFRGVLDNLNATIHKEILDRETKLLAEYEQFKKREEETKEPTQEIIKQKTELDKKSAELEKIVHERREERDQQLTKGLTNIKRTLKEIMDELGMSLGLKIILNKSMGDDNQMEQSIVLFCNEGLDLTNEVIKRLDNKLLSKNFEE